MPHCSCKCPKRHGCWKRVHRVSNLLLQERQSASSPGCNYRSEAAWCSAKALRADDCRAPKERTDRAWHSAEPTSLSMSVCDCCLRCPAGCFAQLASTTRHSNCVGARLRGSLPEQLRSEALNLDLPAKLSEKLTVESRWHCHIAFNCLDKDLVATLDAGCEVRARALLGEPGAWICHGVGPLQGPPQPRAHQPQEASRRAERQH
mmetsp:Transcript_71032/g.230602  ORF Transcript_71032/g.230602 Transcript_71032/m.230602 type:complete len:205 (+) Transcript_71032:182-796(+)